MESRFRRVLFVGEGDAVVFEDLLDVGGYYGRADVPGTDDLRQF